MTNFSHSMLENMMNSMPGMIFWKSPELRYLGANKSFLEFMNLKNLDQLVGRTDDELEGSPERKSYLQKSDRQVLLNKKPVLAIQVGFASFTGKRITLITDKYPIYDEDNQLCGILGILSTKNKDTVTEIYLENIIASVPYNIFWKDTNSIYLGCNQKFADLVNKKTYEIIGKNDYEIGWKSSREAEIFVRGDKSVMGGHSIVNIEENLLHSDGSIRVMLVSKVPVFNEEQQCIGVLGVSVDITERKKLEESLHRALNDAELANKAKTEFIANMSHDIRTPLSGIVGMSGLLENSAISKQKKQYSRWICDSGNQLMELLNGVLDMVSADNVSESDVIEEAFDIRKNIEDISRLELPAIKIKNIRLRIVIDTDVPHHIITDKTKFHRILLNLLGNAIKFTDRGHIIVAVRLLTQNDDRIMLEISVEDTGIGIPEALQSSIFNQFFRATPSYKGIYQGHGIGLHIAKKFVELLGGHISMNSQEGKGARFCFTLPAGVAPEPLPQRPQVTVFQGHIPADINGKKPSLLLVEDNTIALRLLETVCRQAGCDTTSAKDASEALKLFKSRNFDMIISDIGLPGMSGTEMTMEIRDWEKSVHKGPIPVIGLSANPLLENKVSGLGGMNKLLQKPIQLEGVRKIINQFVYHDT